jgi:hypothetical protein
MYGLSPYSKSPYAAIGTVYADFVLENIISETDSEVVVATFITSIIETIKLADSIIGGYSVAITENLNPIDFSSAGQANFVSILEALTILDSSTGYAIFPTSVTEAMTIADVSTQLKTLFVVISESLTSADTISVITAFVGSITENLNPIDKETVITSFNSIINEHFSVNDSLFPRGWFIIDDSQSITWVTINNSQ